jgi:polyphosphate glucokinase
MAKKAIGIDIGGTGIKGAIVDVKNGTLVSERIRYETPEGGHPDDIAVVVAKLVRDLKPSRATLPVGVCFPAVVQHGRTMSAANVSKEWIGLDADGLFENTLNRHVHVLNDADAAGVAEMKFGAGKKRKGLVIMTTLGTGIGTALFMNGDLIPNAELGHIEIDGVDYETQAAYSAKEREDLSFDERLFSPDLFIVGGGISKQWQEFLPKLNLRAEIVPALKRNNAGILGAAALAWKNSDNE